MLCSLGQVHDPVMKVFSILLSCVMLSTNIVHCFGICPKYGPVFLLIQHLKVLLQCTDMA